MASSSNTRAPNIPQPLCEPRPLLPETPAEVLQYQQQQTIMKKKKKQKRIKRCHGNRKKQRFRKKCRAKGMKPTTITKGMKKRFNLIENQTTEVTTNDKKAKNNSVNVSNNKRKRDVTTNQVVRSTSALSIVPSPPKKKMAKPKNNNTTTNTASTSMVMHNNIYRCAPYLKRLSPVLLQALRQRCAGHEILMPRGALPVGFRNPPRLVP